MFKVIGYRLIPITSEFPKDQKISRLIDSFKKEINTKYLKAFHYRYGQPIAYLSYSLTDFNWGAGSREKLITSGLGDLVTDAFCYAIKKAEGKDYKDISLVFEGFGQIRVPLAKGIITVNDTFRLMALGLGPDGKAGSPLVTFWLTGKEIKNFLELETTLAPTREDMHLQINGMRFFYDPKAPEFKRIKTVEVETTDGGLEPLEGMRLYRVCTNWKTILMAESVKNLYKEKIEFTPKDASGNPIIDMRATIVYTDKKESIEMKEWLAIALYLQSFPVGPSGLPEVPAEYLIPKAMVTVVE
jgi:2',3'-cyclic-nucleotide 2'-phosphodiesterase (5'-nucleotidase family)